MEHYFMKSPVGLLKITGNEKGISSLVFCPTNKNSSSKIPPCLKETVAQLTAYFDGTLTKFSVPLKPQGTAFQLNVWNQLQKIPYGNTLSYLEMANQLENPKVIRAAASANGKNPIAIIIPCHRVIGSDGSLTGYSGGLHIKKWLLQHEGVLKQQSLF